MLQVIYVAIGLVTFVYFLLKKKRQRQVVVEITPLDLRSPTGAHAGRFPALQPPSTDSGSPMSVCDSIDSDEDLLDVTPHIQEDYMELYQNQTTTT